MLVGSFDHTIDAKGRVSIPSSFRKTLGDDVILTLAPEGNALYMFSPEGFETWLNSLFEKKGGYDPRDRKDHAIRLHVMGRSVSLSSDSAGRICVPKNMRDLAGLSKEARLMGNLDYVEIWNPQTLCQSVEALSQEEFLDFFYDSTKA